VTPLLLVLAGLVALASGVAVLRTFGPRYRVGRLLATTPRVSVEQARAIAAAGRQRYVRVDGRIDSEENFEDTQHRPLVFRRTRLEARRGTRWQAFEDRRERVAFQVNEGLSSIGVDDAALDAGLVVVPRESVGVASDLGDRRPGKLPGSTRVRARIEQVSSVEHALVLGVPIVAEGGPRMTAGLGRPLVLTTLEPAEAMRVLAGGGTARPRFAAALLGGGVVLAAAGVAWGFLAWARVLA
jgi:hypothetical protein